MYRNYEDDYPPTFADRLRFFAKIFGITFLIAGVGLLILFSKDKAAKFMPGTLKEAASIEVSFVKVPIEGVLGASTQKAMQVSGAIASDIGDGVEVAKKSVLNIKVADIISFVSRTQKIPQDVQKMDQYIRGKVDDVLKSK